MSDEKPPSRTELRRWAAGRGEEMPDFSDEGMRRCWQEHAEMRALLREVHALIANPAQCWKCNRSQIDSDGKVVLLPELGDSGRPVMASLPDDADDNWCYFNPAETGGVCPRCGRSNYDERDEIADQLGALDLKLAPLLARIDKR